MKKLVAGVDLHSNNVVIGIMDQDGKRVAHRKVACELKEVTSFLAPYRNGWTRWRWSPPTTGIGWWTGCAR